MPTVGRPPIVLLVVLGVALASGAAASLLAGATTSPGVAPGPATLIVFPIRWLAYGLFGAALAYAAYLLYIRMTGPTLRVPGRLMVTVLIGILLAVVFVLVLHSLTGPITTQTQPSTGHGTGQNQTYQNTSGLYGSGGSIWSPSLPPWLPFVVLAAVALIALALAVPFARSYLDERRRGISVSKNPAKEKAELSAVLERANRALEEGGDPRTVILALYAAVLAHLTAMVGSVEVDTPEEIRRYHLVRLGIRSDTARELTRLFEEARYSTHPLGPEDGERARGVFREALQELTRAPVAA